MRSAAVQENDWRAKLHEPEMCSFLSSPLTDAYCVTRPASGTCIGVMNGAILRRGFFRMRVNRKEVRMFGCDV